MERLGCVKEIGVFLGELVAVMERLSCIREAGVFFGDW